uniref:Uncharacterized protein n=1 Tax=Chromera velia CCMP2878 TaxID=1169474 RepID=A0A0G4HST6_9ALVE|eukprot:Cvel_1326.t1-p1 / transcript=Cvel_1326.t1 / gene=Cvel_1326 / organism=Chromera_velia_CCMP2878 / gene_product=hypothetical protein / transcript_product=hypothetical protein / location=Cvel_scaffold45:79134-83639(-) / protein_length=97 / sequence_SO=supercontig / SO=protein_coding / is_pseudo=false
MFMRNHSSPWHLFKSMFTDFVSVALELVLPPGSLWWASGGDDGESALMTTFPTAAAFASSELHTESTGRLGDVDGSKANVEPAKEPMKAGRRRNSIT